MKGLTNLLALGTIALTSCATLANSFITLSETDHKTFAKPDGSRITVEIVDTYGSNWKKFSSYLGKDNQWIWTSENSEQIGWYTSEGRSELLVDFNDSVGTSYNVSVDDCVSQATITSKNVSVSSVAGQFSDAVELSFSGHCADVGLSTAIFAPEIGLVKYAEQSIAGPVWTQLVDATIAGVEYPKFHGIEVIAQFPAGQILTNQQDSISAFLTLKNHTASSQTFTFNSSKLFDIELLNSQGEIVNRWSANKRFLMAIQEIDIAAGDSKTFGGEVSLKDFQGNTLDVGTYTIRIELAGSNKPGASAFTTTYFAAESPLYIDQRMTY